MRSLTYLLETRGNGAHLVSVVCTYCGWTALRDVGTLKRNGTIHCSECHALFSPERAATKPKGLSNH